MCSDMSSAINFLPRPAGLATLSVFSRNVMENRLSASSNLSMTDYKNDSQFNTSNIHVFTLSMKCSYSCSMLMVSQCMIMSETFKNPFSQKRAASTPKISKLSPLVPSFPQFHKQIHLGHPQYPSRCSLFMYEVTRHSSHLRTLIKIKSNAVKTRQTLSNFYFTRRLFVSTFCFLLIFFN